MFPWGHEPRMESKVLSVRNLKKKCLHDIVMNIKDNNYCHLPFHVPGAWGGRGG